MNRRQIFKSRSVLFLNFLIFLSVSSFSFFLIHFYTSFTYATTKYRNLDYRLLPVSSGMFRYGGCEMNGLTIPWSLFILSVISVIQQGQELLLRSWNVISFLKKHSGFWIEQFTYNLNCSVPTFILVFHLFQHRSFIQNTLASQVERVDSVHYHHALEFQSYLLQYEAPCYIFSSCQTDIFKTPSVYQLRIWCNVMESGLASCVYVRLRKHIWCLNIGLSFRGYVGIT